jgi:hypothetical protein
VIRRRKTLPPGYAKHLHMLCVSRFDEARLIPRESADYMQSKGLIKKGGFSVDFRYQITVAGVKAHRENCCKQGMNEDDVLVREVEGKLAGDSKPSQPMSKMLMNEADWNDIKKWGREE